MKKVLHILGGLSRGGAETFVMNMFRSIDRENFSFDFLISSEKKGDYYDEVVSLGGKIHRIIPDYSLSPINRILKRFCALYHFFKSHPEYSAVHMHTNNVSCIMELLAAKLAGVKTRIAHSHNTKSRNVKTHMRWRFLIPFVANYRFACGKEAGLWLYGKRFPKMTNARIIPNAIDAVQYAYNEEFRKEIRAEFNIDDKTVIGNIGRIVAVKNQKFLIDLVKQMENTVVLIVGNGPLKAELEKYAALNGVSERVIFVGLRSDTYKFYSAFDCLVMPSLVEGFPVVLVEAQASGVPIVVSDNISRECDLVDGIDFLPLDFEKQQWIEKICRKMESDSAQKRHKAVAMIEETSYNINTLIKEMEAVYTC